MFLIISDKEKKSLKFEASLSKKYQLSVAGYTFDFLFVVCAFVHHPGRVHLSWCVFSSLFFFSLHFSHVVLLPFSHPTKRKTTSAPSHSAVVRWSCWLLSETVHPSLSRQQPLCVGWGRWGVLTFQ